MSYLSDKLNGDDSLKRAEGSIKEALEKKTGYVFNMRNLAENPSYIGSRHHFLSEECSLFSGVQVSESKILTMDNSGFLLLDKMHDEYKKTGILVSDNVSNQSTIYRNENKICRLGDGEIIGKYWMRNFDYKKDAFILTLLDEIYLFNILKLEAASNKVNLNANS